MKRIIFLGLILFSSLHSLKSQELLKQTIRGTVTDAVTGFPLIGANVIIGNATEPTGTTTDMDGRFELKYIAIGRHNIEVSYIGYQSQLINNLLLTSAKEAVVTVQLHENAIEVEEVVVIAGKRKDETQNEMAMVSARTFSVEETERFAGSLGDPARMVANYAGVMTQNDSRNDIIIRGNSPSGVLWRMEGIEIANPNHFGAQGTTGGPVSMVNNNLLTNSDFLTGAFPAEYGNALAGAFDLNLRSGNNQVHEFLGQVGFNGFELGAEGPINIGKGKVKPSYLANFRYSTMEAMNMLGFSFGTGAAIPDYKDFTMLIDIPGTKLGRFKVFTLWGDSFIDLGRDLSDSVSNSYNLRGMATDFGSGLWVSGLSNTYIVNKDMRVKTTVSYQTTYSKAKVDSVHYETESFSNYFGSEETEDKLSVSTQFRHKVNAKNNYSIGFIGDFYSINYLDSVLLYDESRFIENIHIDDKLQLFRAYGQWQHNFTNNLTAYLGLHTQYLPLNSELSVEPRASIRWDFAKNQSINAGIGKHSQMQSRSTYYIQTENTQSGEFFLTNTNLKFSKSNHYMLGYNNLLTPDFRIKLETYYQELYDIPVKENFPEFSTLNTGDNFGGPAEDSLVNKGNGRNYGLELTVEKFLSHGFYTLFTASVFDSKYQGYDRVWRNTAFNGKYVFNLLGGYEYKISKRGTLTCDLKSVWAGGKRYVPVDLEESQLKGEDVRDWTKAYEKKFDDYFRTDLRFGFRLNGKKVSQEWAVDLQNVFNYQSVFMEFYDPNENEVYYVYQQGFLPMFLYRINF